MKQRLKRYAAFQNDVGVGRGLTRAGNGLAAFGEVLEVFVGHILDLHIGEALQNGFVYGGVGLFDLHGDGNFLYAQLGVYGVQNLQEGGHTRAYGEVDAGNILGDGQTCVTDAKRIKVTHGGDNGAEIAVEQGGFSHGCAPYKRAVPA